MKKIVYKKKRVKLILLKRKKKENELYRKQI